MKHYYPNEFTEIGEVRPIDVKRSQGVFTALKAAGLPFWDSPYIGSGIPQPDCHLTVEPSFSYYAVEIRAWGLTAADLASRDETQDRVVTALRAAGYTTHVGPCSPHFEPIYGVEVSRPVTLAYLPDWGGNAPRVALMTPDVTAYLGVESSTLRSYVSRGQAPAADAGEHLWYADTIDRFVATRPGKAGRPPKAAV